MERAVLTRRSDRQGAPVPNAQASYTRDVRLRAFAASLGLVLVVLGSCLDHRASPDCKYGVVPGDKEPGEECEGDDECIPGSVCFEGTCVGDGSLRVSLGWEVRSDFDLHVVTPSGVEIYYANPDAAGGVLDVDDCVGNCSDPDGVHVENIVFAGTPQTGGYQVWVENFSGEGSGTFFVEVEGDEVFEYWEGALPATEGFTSSVYTFIFDPTSGLVLDGGGYSLSFDETSAL